LVWEKTVPCGFEGFDDHWYDLPNVNARIDELINRDINEIACVKKKR
jgi:hypothetical protein